MYKTIRRLLAVSVVAILGLPSAAAQEQTDSLFEFRFVAKRGMFLSPYKGNETELQRLYDCVERHREAIVAGKVPLRVDGYARSAQTVQANMKLARERSNRVKSELITHGGLSEHHFLTTNHAAEGDFVTVRFALPAQCDSAACRAACEKAERERVEAERQRIAAEVAERERRAEEERLAAERDSAAQLPTEPCVAGKGAPRLALRANLLRWATLTPDLGLEWRICPTWSVMVSGSWTSWTWSDNERRYALWEIMPEVRYHLGQARRGYLGAQFKAGAFNHKLCSADGRQGDLIGGGLTGGYSLKLNRALDLDFSLGLGCLHADYDRYSVTRGVRVLSGSASKNYWGVTHAGVSLVWNLF